MDPNTTPSDDLDGDRRLDFYDVEMVRLIGECDYPGVIRVAAEAEGFRQVLDAQRREAILLAGLDFVPGADA